MSVHHRKVLSGVSIFVVGLLALFGYLGIHRNIQQSVAAMNDRDKDWGVRRVAQERISRFGHLAVPHLIAQLKFDPSDPVDFERAFLACETIAKIGPAAESAIPSLVPLLGDHSDMHVMGGVYLSGIAADALAGIGAPSIPFLKPILGDKDWRTRVVALSVFQRIGTEANGITPDLLGCLEDQNPNVRSAAALAVAEVDPDAQEVIPRLIALLGDDEVGEGYGPSQLGKVAGNAARALSNIGSPAIPALKESLKSPDPQIQSMARIALERMDSESNPVSR